MTPLNSYIPEPKAVTLSEFNSLIASLVQTPETAGVWVTAEVSECRVSGGHCYMELVEKNRRGTTVARSRAIIWSNNYAILAERFAAETGQIFGAGIKVMVEVSAQFHPAYGYSLIISDINPDFTMGDMMRRRREILMRLEDEGTIEMNRSLEWHMPSLRIAVVSASGAAGYGDFVNQLMMNRRRLRFDVELFSAVMQGQRAAESIISALDEIASEFDRWDCVVIIRGGGATDDLSCFEDYELASNIAQFPLPVVVGIGHERDVTVLDFVANIRVKTPTAAAEFLIGRGEECLAELDYLTAGIADVVSDRIEGEKKRLEMAQGVIPTIVRNVVERAGTKLEMASSTLAHVGSNRILPERNRLDLIAHKIEIACERSVSENAIQLDSIEKLVEALSPEATLKRGYTITRMNGRVISSASEALPGMQLETVFADGIVESKIEKIKN